MAEGENVAPSAPIIDDSEAPNNADHSPMPTDATNVDSILAPIETTAEGENVAPSAVTIENNADHSPMPIDATNVDSFPSLDDDTFDPNFTSADPTRVAIEPIWLTAEDLATLLASDAPIDHTISGSALQTLSDLINPAPVPQSRDICDSNGAAAFTDQHPMPLAVNALVHPPPVLPRSRGKSMEQMEAGLRDYHQSNDAPRATPANNKRKKSMPTRLVATFRANPSEFETKRRRVTAAQAEQHPCRVTKAALDIARFVSAQDVALLARAILAANTLSDDDDTCFSITQDALTALTVGALDHLGRFFEDLAHTAYGKFSTNPLAAAIGPYHIATTAARFNDAVAETSSTPLGRYPNQKGNEARVKPFFVDTVDRPMPQATNSAIGQTYIFSDPCYVLGLLDPTCSLARLNAHASSIATINNLCTKLTAEIRKHALAVNRADAAKNRRIGVPVSKRVQDTRDVKETVRNASSDTCDWLKNELVRVTAIRDAMYRNNCLYQVLFTLFHKHSLCVQAAPDGLPQAPFQFVINTDDGAAIHVSYKGIMSPDDGDDLPDITDLITHRTSQKPVSSFTANKNTEAFINEKIAGLESGDCIQEVIEISDDE